MTEGAPSRTPTDDQVRQFKDLMGAARESRSEANASAGEAREVFKGLGFGSASIAMFKRLSDMGKETAEATFAELCQLLGADPDFDLQYAQPDMFAAQQVKETKQQAKRRGRNKSNGSGQDVPEPDMVAINDAFERAREHLGTAERPEDLPPAA